MDSEQRQTATTAEGGGATFFARERLAIHVGSLAVFVGLFLLYDFAAYSLPAAVQVPLTYTHGAAVLLIALVDLPLALLVFVASLIFADDISRLVPTSGAAHLHSFMTVPVADVAVGNFVALGIVGLGLLFGLLRWSEEPRFSRLTTLDAAVLGIGGIYVLALIHGLQWLTGNPRGTLHDLNLPIMVCGLYLTVRFHAQTKEALVRLLKYMFLAAGARAVVWAGWALAGVGVEFGTTIRVAFESGRVLLVFVLAAGLALQSRRIDLPRRSRLIALGLAACAAFNLLIHAGRMDWLFAAFACGVLLMLGGLRDKIRWLVVGAVCLVVVVGGLLAVRPELFGTLRYYASTLKFWDIHSLSQSRSSMVRVYEFANIHAQLRDHDNLILGEGPGSHFTDRYYPFPFGLTKDDYSFGDIQSRQFQKPHGLLQTLLLNLGYGGMLVYLTLVGVVYAHCFSVFRKTLRPVLKIVAIILLAFLPAMVYQSWSAKTNMLLGIFLGLAGSLYALAQTADATEAERAHSGESAR